MNNRVLIGVIGNDIHVVANKVISRGLRIAGYNVCNLGVSNMPKDFIYAAIEFEADLVIISTINGEGRDWVIGLRDAYTKSGRGKILLYIGGNLAVGSVSKNKIEADYIKLGFNRAYHNPESLDFLLKDISKDLDFKK